MAVTEQVQGGPAGLLSGLVQGYLGAQAHHAQQDLAQRTEQRDMMLRYLGMLANNPDIAQEHRQWALGKIQEGIQHDISKKPWEVKLSEMPPVMRQAPTPSVQPQVPGAPGIQLPQAPQSSEVGRQGNGEVNALGALPGASIKLPEQPSFMQGRIQGPTPPAQQLTPGGEPHMMTPEEKQTLALDAQQRQMQALQQQFPHKTPEEIGQFMEKGTWPAPVKPQVHTLSPGQQLVEEGTGKVLATNEGKKPGASNKGLQFKNVGTTLISMTDPSTGDTYNDPDDPQMPPEMKQKWAAEQKRLDVAQKKKDDEEDKKNNQLLARAIAISTASAERSAQNAAERAAYGPAVDAAKKAKPMVDIRNTQKEYIDSIRAGAQPSVRKDLALVISAVRAMNPGTVKLPTLELEKEIKAGSYTDRARRWYENAANGTLPGDQRDDLFRVVNDETTHTADSARQAWNDAFGSRGIKAPSYLGSGEQEIHYEIKDGQLVPVKK